MQHIDEYKLYSDLVYRYKYICNFVEFGEKDIALVHGEFTRQIPPTVLQHSSNCGPQRVNVSNCYSQKLQ